MELGEHEPNEPPVADCDCRRCAVATRDALRKDAERYRWLRQHVTDTHANYRDVNGHLQSFDFDCEGDVDLDDAIDTAMAGANA